MEQISRLLEGAGSTPDQVADTLRAARVKGLRDSTSFMNPIVRFINRSLNVGGKLEIGAGGTVLRLMLDSRLKEVALPLPVQVFLDGFHRWLYPDLEASEGG